jgi:hypothetical protein
MANLQKQSGIAHLPQQKQNVGIVRRQLSLTGTMAEHHSVTLPVKRVAILRHRGSGHG